MKIKITKVLSVGVIAMGIIHCAATFSPVIAGKLSVLDVGTQTAFLYMSLMCGAMLILGGIRNATQPLCLGSVCVDSPAIRNKH